MGNYELLKAAINEVIKANGRQEITGEVLNQVLLSMVNSLGSGYQCMGVATPSTNPGTPDQNVFYFATQAGTYTNFDAIVLQAGISVLIWNGNWASQTWFTVDTTPTNNSQNLIASGAVFNALKLDGGAYDVSAHNSGATFASLSALLNSANLATLIPTEIRHGGMSIKFVQSPDNKYIQFRYMLQYENTTAGNAAFLNVANWQGVDDEPIAGSKNLVESGGVSAELTAIKGSYTQSRTVEVGNPNITTDIPVKVKSGQTITIESISDATVNTFRIYGNEAYGISLGFTSINEKKTYTASTDIEKIVVLYNKCTVGGTLTIKINFADSLDSVITELNGKKTTTTPLSDDLITSGAVYNSWFDTKFVDCVCGKNFDENGIEVNDSKSFISDFIPYDATENNAIDWQWGKEAAWGTFWIVMYDSNKNVLAANASTAGTGVIGRTINVHTRYPTTKYIRAAFAIDAYSLAQIKDGYDVVLFKAQTTTQKLDMTKSSILNLQSIGDIHSGIHKFMATGNIKVADINVPEGQFVKVSITTSKLFTRLMIGFNNKYVVHPELYTNVYNNNGLELLFKAPQNLNSFWIFLVSASNPSMDCTWVIQSGIGINEDERKYLDLCVMPSVVYALSGIENSIYHDNYLKFNDNSFFVNPVGTAWKYLDRKFKYEGAAGTKYLSFDIFDKINVEKIIKRKTVESKIGDVSVSTAKVVNVIGDSFTYDGTWYQHIANSVEGLSFVGMRKSYNCQNPLRGEGRGGWSLNSYFQPHDDVTPNHMQPFSPFMHVSGYTYYGVIEFWKAIVNGNSQYTYGTNGFDDFISWFDTNGYKVNPSENDLMYDGTNDKYVYYNGSSWVDFSGTPTFEFNYAKYISTWNITSPDIVIIMLGKNDFQGDASDNTWNAWKSKMDIAITSIRSYATSASKTITIGLCTPSVANEAPNNSDYKAPCFGGRNMWLARKKMIEVYDTDTNKNNNIFVVDSGVCLDPLYGFDLQQFKPFAFYDGDERELISTNGVHPSSGGYKQIGTCVGGFIQIMRS